MSATPRANGSAHRRAILEHLAAHDTMLPTVREIATATHLGSTTVWYHLRRLHDGHYLARLGPAGAATARCYHPSAKAYALLRTDALPS